MDKGHELTEGILDDIEKDINDIYKEAHQAAYIKAAEYMKKFAQKDAIMREKVMKGELTEKEYKQWRLNKMIGKSRYKAMEEGLARDLASANKLAASTINGYLPDVYATNYNWGTYEIEQNSHMNTNFMIYDRQTVERLVRDKPELLPMRANVSIPEDMRWNKKKINNAITQGILLGEGIPDIAKRLANVTDMNRKSAIRNARTMTTSAENGGRIDSYKRAEDMGIKITQEWVATNDGRTRHEHRLLNGQEVKVGEPFKVEGYEIRFPADPEAEPFLVYNCRCCLVSNFKGFDKKKMDKYAAEKPMTYDQWMKQHETAKPESVIKKLTRPETAVGWAYETANGYKNKKKAIEDINRIVDNADIEMQTFWQEYAPELQQSKTEERGKAYFKHSDKRVYFNGTQVQEGDTCHVPYQNHFHEYMHNIDYLNRENKNRVGFFSETWTNSDGKALENVIMGEWYEKFGIKRTDTEIVRKEIASMIKGSSQEDKDRIYVELKSKINKYRRSNKLERDDAQYVALMDKLKECETINQYLEFYKSNADKLLDDDTRAELGIYADKDAVKAYIKKMREKYSLRTRADLSDMMQKFTEKELGMDRPLGVGHDRNYFKNDGALSIEAFAEFGDSSFTNSESLELLKQELPKSYKAWQQMISELNEGEF